MRRSGQGREKKLECRRRLNFVPENWQHKWGKGCY
jgi:hypothetical protein